MTTLRAWWWIPLLLLAGGCFQVEQTISLKQDGSGRLVERLWVADWVVQAAKNDPALPGIADLLDEKSARGRLASYGAVTLLSHSVTNRGCHGIESCTVMVFSNINAVTLPGMLSGDSNRTGTITFALGGRQTSDATTFTGWHYSASRPLRITQDGRAGGAAGSMLPAEKERWVRLLPAMREMMHGFRVAAKLEAFGPIDGRPTHTLYEITDRDLTAGDEVIELLLSGRRPEGTGLRKGAYTVSIAEPFVPTDAQGGKAEGR